MRIKPEVIMPLADSLRPKTLEEYIGQVDLVSNGKPLRKMIEAGNIQSMIFWGPPGSGKTTLARIIANHVHVEFHQLSAVSAGKAQVREIVDHAASLKRQPSLTASHVILFLDEIHRFNKAQQDFLLPYVENGTITLIGATTENPSFSVINALLSRTQVFVLKQHTKDDLHIILEKAVLASSINISQEGKDVLVNYANGDARKLLTLIESVTLAHQKSSSEISKKDITEVIKTQPIRYDKTGEEHYDTISAFIKSMRASDKNAAMYYMARMVEAGEDPMYIARRMVVFASEDIGLAAPTALVVANAVMDACRKIGYPECAINLAHGVSYLASAPKNRSAYSALRKAQADIKKYGNLEIPMEVRNAPTDLMKDLGYGDGYEMYPEDKSYLPEKLKGKDYFKE